MSYKIRSSEHENQDGVSLVIVHASKLPNLKGGDNLTRRDPCDIEKVWRAICWAPLVGRMPEWLGMSGG